ncbi:MAG: ABC-type transporter Mla MlaB component [Psychromonas sp.]
MTKDTNDGIIRLEGNLLLSELSAKKFPNIKTYENTKKIDLQHLTNIDSAGIAYLVQIKTRIPNLCFDGVSDKILILAGLYGVSFLFK